MRSLAVKIFLAFWLIHALIFVVLAILPESGGDAFFVADVRRDGRVAAAMLERQGAPACGTLLAAIEQTAKTQVALYDAQQRLACPRTAGSGPSIEPRWLDAPDGHVERQGKRRMAVARFESAARVPYTVVGATLAGGGREGRPPFPYSLLVTAVLVSGIVCFLLARYVAFPLARMRAATYRLAAGDLDARAGAGVGTRRDEVGDLVRDFDAMADRIASLVHAQTQLLSDISHELRSPLARLNVALELARRKAGTAAAAELERIGTEAARMNQLIEQLLALARAERDERTPRQERVNMADLLRGVADDADYEALRHGKSVTLEADAAADVAGDASLLASAVENVVRNAVRHAPESTAVEIVVSRDAGAVCVTVRDHGPGVPEAELDRIFAPFHRVESARTRQSGGAGLGLAIAQRAVALHGGTITARNAPTGGLIVTMRLPPR